jgi:hypothetical protein
MTTHEITLNEVLIHVTTRHLKAAKISHDLSQFNPQKASEARHLLIMFTCKIVFRIKNDNTRSDAEIFTAYQFRFQRDCKLLEENLHPWRQFTSTN